MQSIPAAAQTAYYAAHLNDLHTRLADVSTWADSARKAALVADYERQIAEYEVMIEVGAELAEADDEIPAECVIIEGDDVQLGEMEVAAAALSERRGWSTSTTPKLAMMTGFAPNGGHIGVTAMTCGGYLITVEHSALAVEVRCGAGELLDTLISHARAVDAQDQSTRYDVGTSLVDAFPY